MTASATPPGWYPAMDAPGHERYWDGRQWTPATRPSARLSRTAALDYAVAERVSRGWRVETRSAEQAVLVIGGDANNVLHLVLTLLTFGFWLVIWLCVALGNRPLREVLTVDEQGVVRSSLERPAVSAR